MLLKINHRSRLDPKPQFSPHSAAGHESSNVGATGNATPGASFDANATASAYRVPIRDMPREFISLQSIEPKEDISKVGIVRVIIDGVMPNIIVLVAAAH
jgi:hypothetical protein